MSTNEFCFVSFFFFFVCLFVCFFFAIALKVPFKVLNGLLKNKTKHPLKKEFFSSMESEKKIVKCLQTKQKENVEF